MRIFEVDAFLPEDERYEFLRNSSFKKSELLGNGFRIKTAKMRGEISQGIALPLGLFPELNEIQVDGGVEVTELLGVKKYEAPETQGNIGTLLGYFFPDVEKTDETRIQSIPEKLEEIKGKMYYVSTKMDGTSVTIRFKDGEFLIGSRNFIVKKEEGSFYYEFFKKLQVEEKLKSLGWNLAIQGEFCGEGIQCNRLKIKGYDFFVFNIIDLDTGVKMFHEEMVEMCNILGLKHVPIEEVGGSFGYRSVDGLLERAKGKYTSGQNKEGIVIRFINDEGKVDSFKVLNNDFLLKEK